MPQNIRAGTLTPSAYYVGSSSVQKMYVGPTLAWDQAVAPPPVSGGDGYAAHTATATYRKTAYTRFHDVGLNEPPNRQYWVDPVNRFVTLKPPQTDFELSVNVTPPVAQPFGSFKTLRVVHRPQTPILPGFADPDHKKRLHFVLYEPGGADWPPLRINGGVHTICVSWVMLAGPGNNAGPAPRSGTTFELFEPEDKLGCMLAEIKAGDDSAGTVFLRFRPYPNPAPSGQSKMQVGAGGSWEWRWQMYAYDLANGSYESAVSWHAQPRSWGPVLDTWYEIVYSYRTSGSGAGHCHCWVNGWLLASATNINLRSRAAPGIETTYAILPNFYDSPNWGFGNVPQYAQLDAYCSTQALYTASNNPGMPSGADAQALWNWLKGAGIVYHGWKGARP
jgi:hypothetical protein